MSVVFDWLRRRWRTSSRNRLQFHRHQKSTMQRLLSVNHQRRPPHQQHKWIRTVTLKEYQRTTMYKCRNFQDTRWLLLRNLDAEYSENYICAKRRDWGEHSLLWLKTLTKELLRDWHFFFFQMENVFTIYMLLSCLWASSYFLCAQVFERSDIICLIRNFWGYF